MANPLNPPTEKELDWLESFLLTRIDEDEYVEGKDEGIFDLSTLDGFFTAIVSGPDVVTPSRWLKSIWGDFEPEWTSEQEAEKAMTLLIRYMNSVVAFLIHDPKNFEPMFAENIVDGKTYTNVEDWCEGYMRGVKLLDGEWQQESEEMAQLLAPIKAFTVEYGEDTYDKYSDHEIEQMQKALTPNVLQIHDYWLQHRTDHSAPSKTLPFRHIDKRPGRNDPCLCGSGKKYKKCCLH